MQCGLIGEAQAALAWGDRLTSSHRSARYWDIHSCENLPPLFAKPWPSSGRRLEIEHYCLRLRAPTHALHGQRYGVNFARRLVFCVLTNILLLTALVSLVSNSLAEVRLPLVAAAKCGRIDATALARPH
jgi:hypothetical protein